MEQQPRRFKVVKSAEPVPVPQTVQQHLPKITPSFLFAGNCKFTVSNGQRIYTFAVRYRSEEKTSRGFYFLRVQATGGRFSYRYVGILTRDGRLKPTGKSAFLQGTPEFDVAQWAVRAVIDGLPIPLNYNIRHDGMCGVCRKELVQDWEIGSGYHLACAPAIDTQPYQEQE